MPLNEYENEIFSCDKLIIDKFISQLDNNEFYLGGQIKMKHNDIINLDSIQQVREIKSGVDDLKIMVAETKKDVQFQQERFSEFKSEIDRRVAVLEIPKTK